MRVDESSASCLLHSFKEGILSAVAHDLEIRVTRFSITVDGEPGAPRSLVASFDAGSLRVASAMKDGVARPGLLGDGDRRTIESTIQDTVLQSRRWPVVTFTVDQLPGATAEWLSARTGTLRLDGRLRLCGVERPVGCVVRHEGDACVTEVDIQQPDFGIKPFSAALGTLRIKPVVRARVSVPLGALTKA